MKTIRKSLLLTATAVLCIACGQQESDAPAVDQAAATPEPDMLESLKAGCYGDNSCVTLVEASFTSCEKSVAASEDADAEFAVRANAMAKCIAAKRETP
ncbi:MAG: hypothetical protein AAGJ86_07095 [Pseudomonadota bacterium]